MSITFLHELRSEQLAVGDDGSRLLWDISPFDFCGGSHVEEAEDLVVYEGDHVGEERQVDTLYSAHNVVLTRGLFSIYLCFASRG